MKVWECIGDQVEVSDRDRLPIPDEGKFFLAINDRGELITSRNGWNWRLAEDSDLEWWRSKVDELQERSKATEIPVNFGEDMGAWDGTRRIRIGKGRPINPTKETKEEKVHRFELAGLGKGPFRLVGYSEERGPIRYANPDGTTTEIGAPGQPMGTCDFCGTGIAHVYLIESSDGKRSKVGSSCVEKVGDKGLKKKIDDKVREVRRLKRLARENKKIEELREILADTGVRDLLFQCEHPHGRDGETLLDWADWMMKNAGNSGKLRVLRTVKEIISQETAYS